MRQSQCKIGSTNKINTTDIVKQKLDKLINTMLTEGVQPGDLADNIFLDVYKQITYTKSGENIIGELSISDTDESYVLRYTYSSFKRIERIEEIRLGTVSVLWDREAVISELINDLVNTLMIHYSDAQMMLFMKTLPPDLYKHIKPLVQSHE